MRAIKVKTGGDEEQLVRGEASIGIRTGREVKVLVDLGRWSLVARGPT